MKKPNCYKCRWRGSVGGSAHSKCLHPYNREAIESPELALFSVFASVGRVLLDPVVADKRLKIKANKTGVSCGWVHYPHNFDPIWIENCEGYEKVSEKDPRLTNNCEKPYFCDECPEKFKCFTERKNVTTDV